MIPSVLLLAAVASPNPTQATISTTARDLWAPPTVAETIAETQQLQASADAPVSLAPVSLAPIGAPRSASDLAPDRNSRTYTFAIAQTSETEVTPVLGDGDRGLEISADRQEFDRDRNIVAAEGNVVIRFSGGTLVADRVRVNLTNRVALATGNVVLTRGEQVLRGDEFEYSFVQDSGRVATGNGEIFQPTANRDFELAPPADDGFGSTVARRTLPGTGTPGTNTNVTDVTATSAGGILTGRSIPTSADDLPEGGGFNRLRFQADRIEFDSDGWRGTNVRITNDPFNPPELAVRADTVEFRRIDSERDEIVTTKSRLVFDGSTTIPLFRNRIVLDRRERPPALFNVGFDDEDRGGLFLERTVDLFEDERVRLSLTPQFFLQRAIEGNDGAADAFGGIGRFGWRIAERTALSARVSLLTFDVDEPEDRRARVRLRQRVFERRPHTIDLAYNLQERIFNGSLGFQDVDESVGLTVLSPRLFFERAGVSLRYQADVQRVRAETDFDEFLDPGEDETSVALTRYQGAILADWEQVLWTGEALPATPEQGLRYSPVPIVPNLRFFVGANGIFSAYSNGDFQNLLSGTVGLRGEFGHFARRAFSYTAFLVSYTNGALSGESPFLFDRAVDVERITLGLTQQLVGPFRLGVRTTLNLDSGDEISTDYILEYSRRTYNIAIRVNPQLEVGSLQLRINAFNYRGTAGPLEQNDIQPVTDGLAR